MYGNNNFDNYDIYSIEQNPHITTPSTQTRLPRRKRKRGNGRVVMLFVLCLFFASLAGFGGGYLAMITMMPEQVLDETSHFAFSGGAVENEAQAARAPQARLGELLPEELFSHRAQEGLEIASGSEEVASAAIISAFNRPSMTNAQVAAAVRDSVVEIKTESVTTGMWGVQRVSEGAGSGVIITNDGFIITNNHVISGAASITVRLADGREFEAELIGADARTDTAVIKIEAIGLRAASFGDSSALEVGEGALAVGNPLGELGGTVTGGIISATDRDIALDGEVMTLLQTDAAVNPGNSGGGLFNMHGELIGVVVAKSGGINIEGLGFAIPSNTAAQVASDLITYGNVRNRADAGLELVDIQDTQAARRHGVNQLGLYILNSQYEGLLRGDRIVAIDNRAITNKLSFNAALRHRNVGDSINITVIRAGNEVTVELKLIEWMP